MGTENPELEAFLVAFVGKVRDQNPEMRFIVPEYARAKALHLWRTMENETKDEWEEAVARSASIMPEVRIPDGFIPAELLMKEEADPMEQIRNLRAAEAANSAEVAAKEEPAERPQPKRIRRENQLQEETQLARREEEQRGLRLRNAALTANTSNQGPSQDPVLDRNESGHALVEVHPVFAAALKPHQMEAIRLLYHQAVESVAKLEAAKNPAENGSGGLLAHIMGLGKTFTCVAFIHTLFSCNRIRYPVEPKVTGRIHHVLILCPVNAIGTWDRELRVWPDKIDEHERTGTSTEYKRLEKLKNWRTNGGVMVMGHHMFKNLVNWTAADGVDSGMSQEKAGGFAHVFKVALTEPGPDLVIVDEAHAIKSHETKLTKAVNRITTRRRFCLTGTPIQNHLKEYQQMVNFAKPSFLGTRREFANQFGNPIANGRYANSEESCVRRMHTRTHILYNLCSSFLHYRGPDTLQKYITDKVALYKTFLDLFVASGRDAESMAQLRHNLLENQHVIGHILNHPAIFPLRQLRFDKEEEVKEVKLNAFIAANPGDTFAIDAKRKSLKMRDGAFSPAARSENPSAETVHRRIANNLASGSSSKPSPRLYRNWFAHLVSLSDTQRMEMSIKTSMTMDIIRLCEEAGDKLLIFTHSLFALAIIEEQLKTMSSSWFADGHQAKERVGGEDWGWLKGRDYEVLSGSVASAGRVEIQNTFNHKRKHRLRLLLISTRAGSLGTDLIGANRVIILDTSWNPAHETQSVFRVSRMGQIKPCFIYRLIGQGTMEEVIYRRQVTKMSEAKRVQMNEKIRRHYTDQDLLALYEFGKAPDMSDHVGEPEDPLLQKLMKRRGEDIRKIQAHDTLLAMPETEVVTTAAQTAAAMREFKEEEAGAERRVGSQASGSAGPSRRGSRRRPAIPAALLEELAADADVADAQDLLHSDEDLLPTDSDGEGEDDPRQFPASMGLDDW